MKDTRVLAKWMLAAGMLLVLAAAIGVSCSGGGTTVIVPDNGGIIVIPPLPNDPVTFNSAQEAAQITSAALSAKAVSETEFAVAMALGVNSPPTSGPSGAYAPAMKSPALAGNIDPALRTALEAMLQEARSPLIRKVMDGIRASKAKRVNSINDTVTDWCSNAEGLITITGQNNYDDINSTTLTSSYQVEFKNCRDDLAFTQLDGKLEIAVTENINTDAIASSVSAKELTEKRFTGPDFAVMTLQSVMIGTFGDDNQVTSGVRSADGSFVVLTPAQGGSPASTVTFAYNNLSDTWSLTHNADGSDTQTDSIAGLFEVILSSSGQNQGGASSLDINLTETTEILNDAAGTRNVTTSGTIDQDWKPDIAGCRRGRITITTTTPRSFTTAGGACPVSGELTVTGALPATVTFGSPIQVTFGIDSVTFPDCTAFDLAGAVCSF